mmetsp:Transcript_17449/g.25780  ORF Transcript_17449/g.25780 Transcript_17449/m.25780 type:complete len:811 (+) Transcript_17449:264-2696(+)|eukprot:CAMPEP_0194214106 /NCGR_PEP_ID=MMETSP0156-20130528/15173_1 /TAXON_ID=33649 /ORGANISM="Thalassionema nitzschioides, Strain L26-B" /LENGTH=810 /DNA_ID=CAMNT_0038942297 /DNA_START=221 /DNA_END=2653 /DNA_ORIENTATION=-
MLEFSSSGPLMESPQKYKSGQRDYNFESPTQGRYQFTNNRVSTPSLTGSSTGSPASPDSSFANSPDKDRNVHVRTNFYKERGYIPPQNILPSASPASPVPPVPTQQERASPLFEDNEELPFDQVAGTFSSVTLETIENCNAPSSNILHGRTNYLSARGTNTSNESNIHLERNTGSRPFDEKFYDGRISPSQEPSIDKTSSARSGELKLLSEEELNNPQQPNDASLLEFGGTWEGPVQVFEDDQNQQQYHQRSSVFQCLNPSKQNKKPEEPAKSPSTVAERRRARRLKMSSVAPATLDDSSLESDQMDNLQARAQHAFSLRQNPSVKSTSIPSAATTALSPSAAMSGSANQSSNKPIKSAIKSQSQSKTQPTQGPTFVSFDENPDTVHHFISDQVHPTFSEEETVTSQDTETSRSIGNQSLDRGMTSILRDLFYLGETKHQHQDDSSNNANDSSVDDSLTLDSRTADSRQISTKDSSMNKSSAPGYSSESNSITIRTSQSANQERSLNGENDVNSTAALIENMLVGFQAMTKAFTQESCTPCTHMKEDFTRNVEYPSPVSTANLLDSASAEDRVYQPVSGEEVAEDGSTLGSLDLAKSMESAEESVRGEHSLDTDPRLAELAFHTAKTVHKLHNLTLDDKDIDSDIITQLEFKVVRIGLPLGLLFHENSGGCWIAKVFPGGNATKIDSGEAVKVGDQLAAVDGRSAIKMSVDDVCALIATAENMQSIELTLLRYVGPLRDGSKDEHQRNMDGNERETRLTVAQEKMDGTERRGKFLGRLGARKAKGPKTQPKPKKDQKKFKLFGKKKKVVL